MSAVWQFWIDRGGTFTDVVARAPDGAVRTAKLLSEDPARAEDAAIAAIRQLTGTPTGPLPICAVRMGTTVATNALLERKGEPCVLAITRGFGDALTIGSQERPELFVRKIVLPQPPHARVIEIDERVTAEGEVLHPLDEAAAAADFAAAVAEGFRSIAIVLMHGWQHTAHEVRLAQLARDAGFTQVSVSHELAPLIKLVPRGDTTLVDAYLSPVLRRYVESFTAQLGGAGEALFMQSSGGLIEGARFHGKDAILSGPAGGIVGMARTAAASGAAKVIGFDMGGTSTDVSHYAGHYERDSETRVAGVRIRTPMLRINTVAAGGGSICRFDAGRLVVGPDSAGAVPGPACYRRGGPLTVTDCNVMLGKLIPDHFPHLFGPGGDQPIDRAVVEEKFTELADQIATDTGQRMDPQAIAEGFVRIAVANMAQAIRQISVARGHDVTSHALACFGGAGGQHACLVADALGIETVLIHPLAGVLSAYGMGLASEAAVREASLGLPLGPGIEGAVEALRARLADEAQAQLGRTPSRVEASLFVRPQASENAIELRPGPADELARAFAEAHRAEFGYDGSGPLVIDRVRVEAVIEDASALDIDWPLPDRTGKPLEAAECWLDGAAHSVAVWDRAALAAGFNAPGPLVIIDELATTVVEPGWALKVDPDGTLRLSRLSERDGHSKSREWTDAVEADPIRLEIFNGLFMGIAEEMGTALARTASSVNIRERLDFSCALFDAHGNLVANAPHLPVHLGSMGEAVRTVIASHGESLKPGDAVVLNNPYNGGTHLPDVTVVSPVFDEAGCLRAFVANRGHHADIGGRTPGSMPPDSVRLEEEGVVIDPMLLASGGRFLESEFRSVLASGAFPARNPDMNVADIKAQLAANATGQREVAGLAARWGWPCVLAYMAHVMDNAEESVRRVIDRLHDGRFS
ncbi:MAG: hydantoinase/oxoprolinase family protein, partial [Novosphingobium sp.]